MALVRNFQQGGWGLFVCLRFGFVYVAACGDLWWGFPFVRLTMLAIAVGGPAPVWSRPLFCTRALARRPEQSLRKRRCPKQGLYAKACARRRAIQQKVFGGQPPLKLHHHHFKPACLCYARLNADDYGLTRLTTPCENPNGTPNTHSTAAALLD